MIDRNGAIGLAKVRKEGFVSMRGPNGGGVLCTRKLRWPGGDLIVNANAAGGVLRVRVSDEDRKVITGFDYTDCGDFSCDPATNECTTTMRGTLEACEACVADSECEKAERGEYVDVHAWMFTPRSFLDLMKRLADEGLTPLAAELVTTTQFGRQEFFAKLTKRAS